MRKQLVFLTALIVIATLGFVVGCSEDNPTSGLPPTDNNTVQSIELRLQYENITGILAQTRTMTLSAIAKNASGVGVPGQRVRFGILQPEQWKGAIQTNAADSVTNENGEISAVYSVVLTQSGTVTFEARLGQLTTHKELTLNVRESVGSLTLTTLRSSLNVPKGQTMQTTVTATLVDDLGEAIAGVLVRFSTRPATLGYVDSDTATTNNSGRASRTFTTIPNQTGQCWVYAEAQGFNKRDSVMIDIGEVVGPSGIILFTTTPNLKVPINENAAIDIEARVTDNRGQGVPGQPVEFRLESVGGAPIFGSLSPRDTTDAEGRIITTFNSQGRFGSVKVVATVTSTEEDGGNQSVGRSVKTTIRAGGKNGKGNLTAGADDIISAELVLTIENLADLVRTVDVSVRPNHMNLPPDSVGTAQVRAVLRDDGRRGVGGVRVTFTTDFGTLSRTTVSDSDGVASATFSILPNTDLPTFDQPTVVTITAEVPGLPLRSTTVTVVPSRTDRGTLTISASPLFQYADNGLTTSTITAVLKDQDNQALAGREITFSSDHGAVSSPVTTDSLGRAIAVFTDIGFPSVDENGNPDSAEVTARYSPMGLAATVRVMIKERNPVSRISLNVAAQQMIAGRGDTTAVVATCYLANDDVAPNGTLVHFQAVSGTFLQEAVSVAGNFGRAQTAYRAGPLVGTDTLSAWVDNGDTIIFSNEVLITLLAGPPSRISLSAVPNQLSTNDPNALSIITATVLDTAGNPVRAGELVSFSTTLGTVTPNAVTDAQGRATALLRPGVQAGLATVTATVNGPSGVITGTTTVTIISGSANTIELEADPLEIQVAGGGGLSSSTLRATLKDPNGNLVEATTKVIFELLNEPDPPAGANINNRGRVDSATTANGVAVATLNAGVQIGGKLIRAYTWRDTARTDTVSVILSTVAVVSGPPSSLDIDVNDQGYDAGGGAWIVEVSARVWDIHRNPVADNIPVVFTVDPEIANIRPGHTGNQGRAGNPVKGLAYADMTYNSVNTFDFIEISAEVQVEDGQIIGTKEHTLPLQEGELELHVDPANWMFPDAAEIRCWVVLKDGHQILINNAPILFTSNRAFFYWFNNRRNRLEIYYPEPARKLTGVVNQEHNEARGQATVFLVAEEEDIFLDPFTLEVTVQINAAVEGYNDVAADPAFIFFTRHG